MSDAFEITLDAPPAVRDALNRIGRIEDVSFSPSNRRLALACFDRNSVALVDIALTRVANRPQVTVTDVVEYSSPGVKTPHGVAFLDDETLLVANRYGKLVALRLSSNAATGAGAELSPIDLPPGSEFQLLNSPGSLAIIRDPDAPVEVLVCNNRQYSVTRHALHLEPLRVTSNEILLRRLLDYPDSVAVSDDNRVIAISNHDAHVVMLYPRTAALSEDSDPDCILRGAMYPHGLAFSPDARRVFVADAGRPLVHVYERDGETWRGVQYPAASCRVMSDEIFELGRDAQSGGPKGVAIDNHGDVLTVTYENQPLAFFDIAAMLECSDSERPDDALRLSYELEALEQGRARLQARTAALMGSRSFRMTKPFRLLNSAVSKKRHE